MGKFKLISGFRPNPMYKRLFELGVPKLEKKLDIVHILKQTETEEDNTIELDKPTQVK